MLTVTFNLRDGTFTDIPDDAHELIIEGYDKLTSSQQVLLKRYIIKHQLDISLQHGVPSSPLHSLNIIKTLRTFVKESKVYHPSFSQYYLWVVLYHTHVCFTHLLVLSHFRRITTICGTLVIKTISNIIISRG